MGEIKSTLDLVLEKTKNLTLSSEEKETQKQKEYITASQNRIERLREDLAQRHNISGSAVLPNLDVDEQWRQESHELRTGYEDQLNWVKDNLLAGRG
jgi:hypothetical protein